MLRSVFRGNSVQERFERRAVPGVACERAVHLIQDAIDFGHKQIPWKSVRQCNAPRKFRYRQRERRWMRKVMHGKRGAAAV
jgi:hypothetical protein